MSMSTFLKSSERTKLVASKKIAYHFRRFGPQIIVGKRCKSALTAVDFVDPWHRPSIKSPASVSLSSSSSKNKFTHRTQLTGSPGSSWLSPSPVLSMATATAATTTTSMVPQPTFGRNASSIDLDDPESRHALQCFVEALSLVNVRRNNTSRRSDLWNNILDDHTDDYVMQRQLQQQLQVRRKTALDELESFIIHDSVETRDDDQTDNQDGLSTLSTQQLLASQDSMTSMSQQKSDLEKTEADKRISPSERLLESLNFAIRKHQVERSLKLYDSARRKNIQLNKKLISDLFFDLSLVDPIEAYSILQDYNNHPETERKRLAMYKRICTSVSILDPSEHSVHRMHTFIESLLADIEEMDDTDKEFLYPNLVVTLSTQRLVFLGKYSGKLYQYMKDNNFDLRLGWLTKVLSLSKYNRQGDLPYHDILSELAARDGTPAPNTVLPAIQNMFPFTDTNQMTVALRAYLKIEHNVVMEKQQQQQQREQQQQQQQQYHHSYDNEILESESGHHLQHDDGDEHQLHGMVNRIKIDLSTLERISDGASRAGDSDLIMLVWDVMDHCGYEPTEAIYENTVLSFASEGRNGLRQAFSAMATMKEDGFIPSRALIRGFCYKIRSDKRLVNQALRILLEDESNPRNSNDDTSTLSPSQILPLLRSLESFNVILSCLAERGDTSDTLEMLSMFETYGIQPNEDSYSFAMEALGKEIHRLQLAARKRSMDSHEDPLTRVNENVQLAGSLLSEMEENGLTPTSDVVRNYLELLCLAEEVETATTVLENLLKEEDYADQVNNKAIYRVAIANAKIGSFDKAIELAALTSESIATLYRKIKSMKQRAERKRRPTVQERKLDQCLD